MVMQKTWISEVIEVDDEATTGGARAHAQMAPDFPIATVEFHTGLMTDLDSMEEARRLARDTAPGRSEDLPDLIKATRMGTPRVWNVKSGLSAAHRNYQQGLLGQRDQPLRGFRAW
jgi:hypothetical protein